MNLVEKEILVPTAPGHRNLIAHIENAVALGLGNGGMPVRFAITRLDDIHYQCELGMLEGHDRPGSDHPDSLFRFVPRKLERTDSFNAVFMVPTGTYSTCGAPPSRWCSMIL